MNSGQALPPALVGEVTTVPGVAGVLRCYRNAPRGQSAVAPLLLVHSVNAAASAAEVRPLYDHYRALRPVYALAVSLGSEFLARAAMEAQGAFRSVALVSPTGFSGSKRRAGPPGGTRAVPGLHAALSGPWAEALFRGLTRPGVIRYFLERTWGSKAIDEELWRYDVLTTRVPGARFAPLHFLSAGLFSADIEAVYEALALPVWVTMASRGDFTDYRRRSIVAGRPHWRFVAFDGGALPYFEPQVPFIAEYDRFLVGIN